MRVGSPPFERSSDHDTNNPRAGTLPEGWDAGSQHFESKEIAHWNAHPDDLYLGIALAKPVRTPRSVAPLDVQIHDDTGWFRFTGVPPQRMQWLSQVTCYACACSSYWDELHGATKQLLQILRLSSSGCDLGASSWALSASSSSCCSSPLPLWFA